MAKNNSNNPQILHIPIGAVAADVTKQLGILSRKARLVRMSLLDPTGVAASDANKLKASLMAGATLLAEYDTALTGGDGPLVANTWAHAPEKDVEMPANTALTLIVDVTGTGALAAGSLLQLEMHPL